MGVLRRVDGLGATKVLNGMDGSIGREGDGAARCSAC